MPKTLSVTALASGTVIDHLPAGQAIKLVQLLHLADDNNRVTLGLNLASERLGFKDLIKVKDKILTPLERQEIAVLAPTATINIIKDFKVVEKTDVQLPKCIKNMLVCPNPRCISHAEPVISHFSLEKIKGNINLSCYFCEKTFLRDEIKEYAT